MLSSNFNGSFQFQPQSQSNQQFATSVDSTSGSIGANSLLTAANTLIFNSPASQQNAAAASSLSSSYIKSPFVTQHLIPNKSLSQSPKQLKLSNSGNFSRQLLELQQTNLTSDLDFDLHYNVPQKQNELNDLNLNNKKAKNPIHLGDFVFNDDDDQLDLDDNLNDNDEDLEDDSSNSSLFNMKRMPNEIKLSNDSNQITIGKILDNPIGYSSTRLIQNQSMNMPIEQMKTDSKSNTNSDNIVNSIKKVNFLDEASPINSLSSYIG